MTNAFENNQPYRVDRAREFGQKIRRSETRSERIQVLRQYFDDHARAGRSRIVDVQYDAEGLQIEVAGPQAYSSVILYQAESRSLARVLQTPVFVYCDQRPSFRQFADLPVDSISIGVTELDQITKASRKILRFHFARMAFHEPETRRGVDVEALHDMRVATRRLRSAFSTFRPFYIKEVIKPFRKGLRSAGRVLGVVRDLDVFLGNLELDLAATPGLEGLELSALRGFWRHERDQARSNMIRHLDSPGYQRLLVDFSSFLNSPMAGVERVGSHEARTQTVRNTTAELIEAQWRRVKSFDDEIPGASAERLHRLRIETKKFRYAIEFFRDVLGDQSEHIIIQLKQLQDHLGRLNDSVVAVKLVEDFLSVAGQNRSETSNGGWREPAQAYLSWKQEESARLVRTLPGVWFEIERAGFEDKLIETYPNDFSR